MNHTDAFHELLAEQPSDWSLFEVYVTLADARALVAGLSPGRRAEALREWAGQRGDRRQRPGRALEATTYTFEIVCDYGAYRDLQRHRLLTLQALSRIHN